MDKYGFVYLWYDKKHKRYYLGAHWGTPDDGYICSSTWMKQAYKHRPKDFKKRIITTINTNQKDLYVEEYRWLQMIKSEELGKRYYNYTTNAYHYCGGYISKETKLKMSEIKKHQSPETRQKISDAAKRRWKSGVYNFVKENHPMYGKTHTLETRQKISQAKIGKDPWNKGKKFPKRAGKNNPSFGIKRSFESRQKMSLAAKQRWERQRLAA